MPLLHASHQHSSAVPQEMGRAHMPALLPFPRSVFWLATLSEYSYDVPAFDHVPVLIALISAHASGAAETETGGQEKTDASGS